MVTYFLFFTSVFKTRRSNNSTPIYRRNFPFSDRPVGHWSFESAQVWHGVTVVAEKTAKDWFVIVKKKTDFKVLNNSMAKLLDDYCKVYRCHF